MAWHIHLRLAEISTTPSSASNLNHNVENLLATFILVESALATAVGTKGGWHRPSERMSVVDAQPEAKYCRDPCTHSLDAM